MHGVKCYPRSTRICDYDYQSTQKFHLSGYNIMRVLVYTIYMRISLHD